MEDKGVTFEAPADGWALPPVHPGEVLGEEIGTRGLSVDALALKLRVSVHDLGEIVGGKRAVSAEMALRLGRSLGTGAALWLNLQSAYDLAKAWEELGARIAEEVEEAV